MEIYNTIRNKKGLDKDSFLSGKIHGKCSLTETMNMALKNKEPTVKGIPIDALARGNLFVNGL